MGLVAYFRQKYQNFNTKLECGPMPSVMAALRNIGGANEKRKFRNSLPCRTPQSLANAHLSSAAQ